MSQKREDELRFHPTSGRATGILAVLGAVAVVVLQVGHPDGTPLWAAPAAVLLGVLAWASILWPRLSIDAEDLVLRNMVETVRVPLTAIEGVVVRQYLAVWSGGKRYVSSTVGKSWRTGIRNRPDARTESGLASASKAHGATASATMNRHTIRPTRTSAAGEVDYVDYVVVEINKRVEMAKDAGDGSSTKVRREPAWLPIGLIVASVLALLISILL